MAKLLLFDVDQTLLSTEGADRKALNEAFEELFGIPDGFVDIQFFGRMDLAIVGDAFRKWGIDHAQDPGTMDRFKEAYLDKFSAVLEDWADGREFPGVRELLESLSRRKDVNLGLATGNFREAAILKLQKYRFDEFFVEGGFGGEAGERRQVVSMAIERCQARTGKKYAKEDIYVIGDSPSDIIAGKANGVRTVAVATGNSSLETLRTHDPTHLFPDLSDTEAFMTQVLAT